MHSETFEQPSHPSIPDFFELLGDALGRAHPSTIAGFWEAPALIVSDAGVHAPQTAADVRAFYASADGAYAAQGIAETRPDVEHVAWLSPRVVQVQVLWTNLSAEGAELGEERATYTLRVDDNGALRIRAMVLHAAQAH